MNIRTESIVRWVESRVVLGAAVAVSLGIGAVAFAYLASFSGAVEPNVLGDYVGGISGSLFSLAAFLLIYRTLKAQQEQLETQRLELQQSRWEVTLQNLYTMAFSLVRRVDETSVPRVMALPSVYQERESAYGDQSISPSLVLLQVGMRIARGVTSGEGLYRALIDGEEDAVLSAIGELEHLKIDEDGLDRLRQVALKVRESPDLQVALKGVVNALMTWDALADASVSNVVSALEEPIAGIAAFSSTIRQEWVSVGSSSQVALEQRKARLRELKALSALFGASVDRHVKDVVVLLYNSLVPLARSEYALALVGESLSPEEKQGLVVRGCVNLRDIGAAGAWLDTADGHRCSVAEATRKFWKSRSPKWGPSEGGSSAG